MRLFRGNFRRADTPHLNFQVGPRHGYSHFEKAKRSPSENFGHRTYCAVAVILDAGGKTRRSADSTRGAGACVQVADLLDDVAADSRKS